MHEKSRRSRDRRLEIVGESLPRLVTVVGGCGQIATRHAAHLRCGGRGGDAGYERLQVAAADRVLQLADGLGLDLPDALAGDLEDVADFFQRVGVAVAQAVAELDDLALAVGQRLQQLFDLARAACRCWPACSGLSVPVSSMKSPK